MRIGWSSRRGGIAIQVVVAFLAVSARAWSEDYFSTKWAIDDERYAQQHSAPYSDNTLQRWTQVGQEMVDARFQNDNYGVYIARIPPVPQLPPSPTAMKQPSESAAYFVPYQAAMVDPRDESDNLAQPSFGHSLDQPASNIRDALPLSLVPVSKVFATDSRGFIKMS